MSSAASNLHEQDDCPAEATQLEQATNTVTSVGIARAAAGAGVRETTPLVPCVRPRPESSDEDSDASAAVSDEPGKGAETPMKPLCDDALECYLSVHAALRNLTLAAVLGHVANGVKVEDEDDDDDDEEEEEEGEEGEEEELDNSEETGDVSAHKCASDAIGKKYAGKQGAKLWSEELGTLLDTIHTYTAFACGGSVGTKLQDYHKHEFNGKSQVLIYSASSTEVVSQFKLTQLMDATELLKYCVPAPFGDLKTQTTILDPTVRLAMEVVASNHRDAAASKHTVKLTAFASWKKQNKQECKCRTGYGYGARCTCKPTYVDVPMREVEGEAPLLHGMYTTIRNSMIPSSFGIVPYKLNVYGPGGFFKPHVDTPSVDSANMLGTVVVCLPSEFTGGDLIVRAPSGSTPSDTMGRKSSTISTTFKWDTASTKTDNVQWAAFYGDCAHEVTPVTSGHRVTMTFAIVRGPEPKFGSGLSSFSDHVAKAPFISAMHIPAMLAHVAVRPKAVTTFGILLAHKYTFTGVKAEALKGLDRLLLDHLQSAGYVVTVRPVIYRAHIQGAYPDSGDRGTASNVVYAFGAEELEKIRNGEKAPDADKFITFVRPSNTGVELFHEDEEEIEYTGNEAQAYMDDTIYFSAALIISGNPA